MLVDDVREMTVNKSCMAHIDRLSICSSREVSGVIRPAKSPQEKGGDERLTFQATEEVTGTEAANQTVLPYLVTAC